MTCVYFILDFPETEPSLTAAFVKALPVLSLAWLVCLQGIGIGKPPNRYTTYNRRILAGLLISSMGDVLLIYQVEEIYFILGMLAFAVAQMCYITAFGFSPFGLKEFVLCTGVVLVVLLGVMPYLPNNHLQFMVPIYASLVATMQWRSLARFSLKGDIPWRKIFSAVGGAFFVISDTGIAVHKFCFEIPFQKMFIMGTYYAAQVCISLSVINSQLHNVKQPYPPIGKTKTGSSHFSGHRGTEPENSTFHPHSSWSLDQALTFVYAAMQKLFMLPVCVYECMYVRMCMCVWMCICVCKLCVSVTAISLLQKRITRMMQSP